MAKKGDLVNVHFTTSDSLFRCRVLYTPADVGDCWTLEDEDGGEHSVILFERMDVIKEDTDA